MAERKWLRKVDTEKKKIYIDWNSKSTVAEERKVDFYSKQGGYKIVDYSETRAEKIKKNADGLNKEIILKDLESDAVATAKFKKLLEDEGFFVAKSWYLYDYKGKERKTKKK